VNIIIGEERTANLAQPVGVGQRPRNLDSTLSENMQHMHLSSPQNNKSNINGNQRNRNQYGQGQQSHYNNSQPSQSQMEQSTSTNTISPQTNKGSYDFRDLTIGYTQN